MCVEENSFCDSFLSWIFRFDGCVRYKIIHCWNVLQLKKREAYMSIICAIIFEHMSQMIMNSLHISYWSTISNWICMRIWDIASLCIMPTRIQYMHMFNIQICMPIISDCCWCARVKAENIVEVSIHIHRSTRMHFYAYMHLFLLFDSTFVPYTILYDYWATNGTHSY